MSSQPLSGKVVIVTGAGHGIGAGTRVERNAAGLSYFVSHSTGSNLVLHSWAVAVAETHRGDSRFRVACRTGWACTLGAFGAFAIPVTAKQDPSADGHLAVYDPATRREWDMWQAKPAWTASAGSAVSTTGDGIAATGTASGDAANFPLLGGLIRPEEILQGHIDHALVFSLPGIASGAPICPATHNAQTTSDPSALREGQRVQLDPSVDVDALSIPGWEKTIARAMQQYGMYLRDNGGTLGVYAENPISRGYDAWSPLGLGSVGAVSLSGIPWSRFRLLAPPAGC